MGYAGIVAIAGLVLAFANGCGATCDISDEGNPPEIFTGGAVANPGEEFASYASSAPQGPLLYFPGGKQYQLVHHLGFAPNQPIVDFAFATYDRSSTCSGNSCEILCWDDQIIWVKNDTCTEFWIRVSANGRSPQSVPRCVGDNIDGGTSDDGGVISVDDAASALPPDDGAGDATSADPP